MLVRHFLGLVDIVLGPKDEYVMGLLGPCPQSLVKLVLYLSSINTTFTSHSYFLFFLTPKFSPTPSLVLFRSSSKEKCVCLGLNESSSPSYF